jgi:fermentation-respiration switch protein FrsA (DUF1100 family)
VVQYFTTNEGAQRNRELIEDVLIELAARDPGGVEYQVLMFDDGVSFMHLVAFDGTSDPFADCAAYREFPVPPTLAHDRKVTLRSTLKAQMYDPGVWSDRVSPTPLLMVVGTEDTVTPADLALAAFERAGDPKKLVTYPGGHFDAYLEHFETTSGAAEAWFTDHLTPKDARR